MGDHLCVVCTLLVKPEDDGRAAGLASRDGKLDPVLDPEKYS